MVQILALVFMLRLHAHATNCLGKVVRKGKVTLGVAKSTARNNKSKLKGPWYVPRVLDKMGHEEVEETRSSLSNC